MFWKRWFKRSPFATSEEALRFMFRLGKEAARQEHFPRRANTEPIVLLQTCPVHGCLLGQAEMPDGNGNWLYCPRCREERTTISSLATLPAQKPRPGSRLHVENAKKRMQQRHGYQLPPARPLKDQAPTLIVQAVEKERSDVD